MQAVESKESGTQTEESGVNAANPAPNPAPIASSNQAKSPASLMGSPVVMMQQDPATASPAGGAQGGARPKTVKAKVTPLPDPMELCPDEG